MMIFARTLAVIGSLTVCALAAAPAHAVIPGTAVTATQYDITIQQVELCSDAACNASVIVGTGTSTFDIAGVNAGADVGSYASTSGLTAGDTFTHVRVTIGTAITIAGGGLDNGGQNCQTVTGNAAGGHAAVGTGTVGGAGTPMALTIPNVGVGGVTVADYAGFNMTKVNGAATAQITFPLVAPFTVGDAEPLVKITFDTTNALGALQTGAGTCSVFPRPPSVSIDIQ